MMITDAGHESSLPPASRGDSFLERLASKMGGAAHASAVFGAPVEHEGVKVIPVAKARWGFGGGSGTGSGSKVGGGEGSGGGGGVWISPVGYIELKKGASRFRPIRHPTARLPGMIAGGLIALLIARALGKGSGSSR